MTPASLLIRVVLADDHQMVREGLQRLLGATGDIRVVGEACDGHQVIERLKTTTADVLVLDLSMPGPSGIDMVHRVKTEYPRLALLVLTMHAEEQYAMRALRAGANGYITKDCAAEDLIHAIRKVAAGGGYVTPALAERLAIDLSQQRDGPPHTRLSERELQVLRLIVAGKRQTEIARTLHLSVKTVSTHKTRLQEKLQVAGTAALVRYALQYRLFDELLPPEAGNGAAASEPPPMLP